MSRTDDPADLAAKLRALQTTYPPCGYVSIEPARTWDDGTVVGNGIQGALSFGRTTSEELVLSHEELFLPLHPFPGYLPAKEHLETMRRLVAEGKAGAAQELLHEIKVQTNAPRYNTTDPFVGAGSLDVRLRTGPAGGPEDAAGAATEQYVRSVDFATGESLTAWQDESGLFHRRLFVSRSHNVIVMRVTRPDGGRFRASLRLREIAYEPPTDPLERDIYVLTIEGCESSVGTDLLTHRMKFKNRLRNQRIHGCLVCARVLPGSGATTVRGEWLDVDDADELMVLLRIIPDRKEDSPSVDREAKALADIGSDYDALLEAHARVHGEMFERLELRLSAPDEQQRSTEDLQASSAVGNTPPALVEKAFAAARYGVISSTGNLPPVLQGVWTGTWKPRWSGDYTLNGNVQSVIAASLCGNHYECMESLFDYFDTILDDFRDNARELLGYRGFLIPWRSSTNGRTHYLSFRNQHHNFPGIYWFAGAAWFAQFYVDYYLYTGDETFLRDRLSPFLMESVAFYEDYLSHEQGGRYVLSPSSSPENETEDDIWMAPNATMTIAAIGQLLRNFLFLREQLPVDDARAAQLEEMLGKLPPYEVGATGALKEWSWPGIENQELHRHASHLFPLYFGVDPQIAASDRLREACRVAIDRRMEFRRPEEGGMMAFGFTQLGTAAAHLGDADLAYESVEYLVNSYWSPAMVSQHDPHNTMNLDISGGLPAVIITMLIQSLTPERPTDPWIIKLLPVLPGEWPNGRLSGVRCRGGFEVAVTWADGKLTEARLTSLRGESCLLEYGERSARIESTRGETYVLSGELGRR